MYAALEVGRKRKAVKPYGFSGEICRDAVPGARSCGDGWPTRPLARQRASVRAPRRQSRVIDCRLTVPAHIYLPYLYTQVLNPRVCATLERALGRSARLRGVCGYVTLIRYAAECRNRPYHDYCQVPALYYNLRSILFIVLVVSKGTALRLLISDCYLKSHRYITTSSGCSEVHHRGPLSTRSAPTRRKGNERESERSRKDHPEVRRPSRRIKYADETR